VGMEFDKGVIIGGDSLGTAGILNTQRKDPKVFTNDRFVIGYSGSYRMGQLLRFSLKVKNQECDSDYEFMCTTFVNAVRGCFKNGGFLTVNNGKETGGFFLVGYKGKLYYVESDMQVGVYETGYISCGSGNELALASIFTSIRNHEKTSYTQEDAKKIVHIALDTASMYDSCVGGRTHFISQFTEKEK
tara:strand:+ start:25 stop:588 length:564 start_codon:yes stop_codon:yes gene_type:complete